MSSKLPTAKAFKNVKETWDNKYVFYTPKIVYGIDYVPNTPTPVYAFFQCTSISPLAFSQMVSRCRNISHLRYFIEERNHNLQFTSADDIKNNYSDALTYISDITKTLDKSYKDDEPKKNKKYSAVKYYEYDSKRGEIVNLASMFDQMFWQQQYFHSVMRSAMNHHFHSILREKGYDIWINDKEGTHKIDMKQLKEDVKEKNNEAIESIIKDPENSLTAGEKKIKESMEKRAEILRIDINCDKYREELADDRKFTTHLNICELLNTYHDDKFLKKTRKEFSVQNVTSNTMKIKLINEVQTIMNVSPLCINDMNNDVAIPADKQEVIKKVFRLTNVNLISMYSNLVPNLVKSNRVMVDGVRSRVYEIDPDMITHHLDLLCHRNKKLDGIDKNTLNYFGYKPKTQKLL